MRHARKLSGGLQADVLRWNALGATNRFGRLELGKDRAIGRATIRISGRASPPELFCGDPARRGLRFPRLPVTLASYDEFDRQPSI